MQCFHKLCCVFAYCRSFVGGNNVYFRTEFAQGFGQYFARFFSAGNKHFVAFCKLRRKGFGKFFCLIGAGNEVGFNAAALQCFGGAAADGGNFYACQSAGIKPCVVKACEEGFNAVGAGKHQPFIGMNVFNCFVKRGVGFGRHNFNGRRFDNLCSFGFQLFGKGAGLRACARYNNGFAKQGLVVVPAQLLTQFYHVAYNKNGRRLQPCGGNICGSSANGGNKGLLFGVGAPADNGGRGIGAASVFNKFLRNFGNVFHAH